MEGGSKTDMKKKPALKSRILKTLFIFSLGCCFGIHRRVVFAMIKGEPLPKAPAWHWWCK